MTMTRVLTGITTTGTPHLGNYVGAIRPAIAASQQPDVEAYLFLADFHALIKNQNPDEVAQSSREIAATWLALGLDPERSFFLSPVRYSRNHGTQLDIELFCGERLDESCSRL